MRRDINYYDIIISMNFLFVAFTEVEDVPLVLLPCTTCGRTFRPEALAKHVKVCEKTLMKKRKAFDSAKQRLQGTEVESFPAPKTTKNHPRKRETKAKVIIVTCVNIFFLKLTLFKGSVSK